MRLQNDGSGTLVEAYVDSLGGFVMKTGTLRCTPKVQESACLRGWNSLPGNVSIIVTGAARGRRPIASL